MHLRCFQVIVGEPPRATRAPSQGRLAREDGSIVSPRRAGEQRCLLGDDGDTLRPRSGRASRRNRDECAGVRSKRRGGPVFPGLARVVLKNREKDGPSYELNLRRANG